MRILNGKLPPILEKSPRHFIHQWLLDGVVYISDRKHVGAIVQNVDRLIVLTVASSRALKTGSN